MWQKKGLCNHHTLPYSDPFPCPTPETPYSFMETTLLKDVLYLLQITGLLTGNDSFNRTLFFDIFKNTHNKMIKTLTEIEY